MSGSLAEWGCGEAEVMTQLDTRKLSINEVEGVEVSAGELYNNVNFLYSQTFVKELSDCRVHLKSLLLSVKTLKQKLNGEF